MPAPDTATLGRLTIPHISSLRFPTAITPPDVAGGCRTIQRIDPTLDLVTDDRAGDEVMSHEKPDRSANAILRPHKKTQHTHT